MSSTSAIPVPAPAPAATGGRHKKKAPAMGPVRANLEAFGVAILGAVLLKWFCLEAFQIPTSSMQPTLMGSSEAGIFDRVLVDKFLPVLRAPQRWDVTVFGYPLQQNQNYVKRLVGLPGEKLCIAGGNLYLVEDKDGRREFHVLRKPARIQEQLWKEVYPARQLVRGDGKGLGKVLFASPGMNWSETEPGYLAVDLQDGRSTSRLALHDEDGGGFIDLVWDGYDTEVARAIKQQAGSLGNEIVPDARIEASFTPAGTIDELLCEIDVLRPGHDRLTYTLQVKDGKGRLQVRGKDGTALLDSPGFFVCELPPGRATRLGFAHLDDMLYAWREGEQVMQLDTSAFHCREDCELPLGTTAATDSQRVWPQLTLKGKGKVAITELRVCRDLHYTTRGFDKLPQDHVIEIPADHYFMMGDNTQQSVDSRGWTALELGVLPDGTVVPPPRVDKLAPEQWQQQHPGARVLRGNRRIMQPSQPPDRDETPVVIGSHHALAMIDEFGDVHALTADVDVVTDKNSNDLSIHLPGAQNGRSDWRPPSAWVPFVPREHIRGRALLTFWRWPFPRLSPIK